MTFTYNIQKVDFFVDQIEDKGQIDLDGAIDAFQNFRFADQLKQADERELTSCLPTISFKSNDGKTLGIWAQDDKGFFLHYDNGSKVSEFFLSNDFEKNPEGLVAEEFIEQFFDGTIEQLLKLEDKLTEGNESEVKPTTSNQLIEFSFANTKKIKYYLWTVPFLIMAVFLFKTDIEKHFELGWGLHIMCSFLWLPGTIVHLSYWLKNHNVTVRVDPQAKTLEYEKDGQVIKINRNEIYNCELNETRSGRAPWNSYRYLWIVLNDRKQIVITNFITEPENIINLLKLNFKTDRRTIPFLPI